MSWRINATWLERCTRLLARRSRAIQESSVPSAPTALASVEEAYRLCLRGAPDERTAEVLGRFHWSRHRSGAADSSVDLAQAVSYYTIVFAARPQAVPLDLRTSCAARMPHVPGSAKALNSEGNRLLRYPQTRSDQAALDRVVSLFRRAVETAPDQSVLGGYLTDLNAALMIRFSHSGDQSDVDEAVAVAHRALGLPSTSPKLTMVVSTNLAAALRLRFELTGDLSDLDDEIAARRRAAELIPPGSADRGSVQDQICRRLLVRFSRSGTPEDLGRAIAQATEALAVDVGIVARDPSWVPVIEDLLDTGYQVLDFAEDLTQHNNGRVASQLGTVELARRWIAHGNDHQLRFTVLNRFAANLARLFETSGDLAQIDEAVDIFRSFLDLTDTPPPAILINLGHALSTRYQHTKQPSDSAEALHAYFAAADAATDPHELRSALAGIHEVLPADPLAAPADLDRWISLLRRVVDSRPLPNQADRYQYLCYLAAALSDRHHRSGALQDLDDAITQGTAAVRAATQDAANQHVILTNLGGMLRIRFAHSDDPGDIDQALHFGRRALAAVPLHHPDRALCLSNLAGTLATAAQVRDGRPRLDEAEALSREAVRSTPRSHPNWTGYLAILAHILAIRQADDAPAARYDDVIELATQAASSTPEDHPDLPKILGGLAQLYRQQYHISHRRADLDAAAVVERRALALCPSGPDRTQLLSGLADSLLLLYQHTGDAAQLRQQIAALREAIAAPARPISSTSAHLKLAWGLLELGERTGELAHVDAAIRLAEQLLNSPSPTSDLRVLIMSALVAMRRTRSSVTGSLADVDQAVQRGREAANLPASDEAHHSVLVHLCYALRTRYTMTRQQEDLDESVEVGRQALAALPPRGPRGILALIQLGASLGERYDATGHPADLAEVIRVHQDALRLVGDDYTHPARWTIITHLSQAFAERAVLSDNLADLDEAVTLANSTLDHVPDSDPVKAMLLSTLAGALRRRYAMTRAAQDLADGLRAQRRVVALTPDDHPARSQRLVGLAAMLVDEYQAAGNVERLTEALPLLRDAYQIQVAPPHDRITAARLFGSLSAQTGDDHGALEGLSKAVELLPRLAWRGVGRATREEQLRRLTFIASDAAALAIRVGKPKLAVELLEQGRAVLWSQTLQIRTDFTALAEVAPDLAAALTQLRDDLDALPEQLPTLAGAARQTLAVTRDSLTVQAQDARLRDARARMAREWDELVGKVRAVPEFRNFLQPTPFTDLIRPLAAPVVMVNVSQFGCAALVVTTNDVTPVPLPKLQLADAIERTNTLLEAEQRAAPGALGFAGQVALNQALTDVLGWLWQVIARPVTQALETSPTDTADLRRLCWCPTGPLTLLPLHAACGDDGSLSDLAISSYTPTLAAMSADRAAPPVAEDRMLFVGVPETPDEPDLPALPNITEELAAVTSAVGGRFAVTTLLSTDAQSERVLKSLTTHSIAHLACHGIQDLQNPSAASLRLWDRRITVLDLANARLGPARLAYLSACQTAVGGVHLLDESLHLAGAFRLLGYDNVIATLWAVADLHTPAVVRQVYDALASSGTVDSDTIADALHGAVALLRREFPGQPAIWAGYVHVGGAPRR